MLLLICVINLLRILYVFFDDPLWDAQVRKSVFFRFDSLLFGIYLATVKVYQFDFYEKLAKWKVSFFCMFFLCCLGIWFCVNIPNLNKFIFTRTIMFTLVSACMVFCIPFFEQNQFINIKLKSYKMIYLFFYKCSIYSYIIYLIHAEILNYFFRMVTSFWSSIYFCLFFIVFTVGLAAGLHSFYEQPILDKRKKVKEKVNMIMKARN